MLRKVSMAAQSKRGIEAISFADVALYRALGGVEITTKPIRLQKVLCYDVKLY